MAKLTNEELIEAFKELSIIELSDFVKQAIAPYKRPRVVEFRDELPRTSTGKLQRYRLR